LNVIDAHTAAGGRADPALGDLGAPDFLLNIGRLAPLWAPTSDQLRAVADTYWRKTTNDAPIPA